MCGIIGIVGNKSEAITNFLVNGLKALEYRGYDSAGVAFISEQNLRVIKTTGKVRELAELLRKEKIWTDIGIGHTRWATHGKPSEINAHPISVDNLAIVHNGVIENYQILKQQLLAKGIVFRSDTDSEVIVQMIADFLRQGNKLMEAIKLTVAQLRGSYVFALLSNDNPEFIYAVKKGGNPLVVGLGREENYLASDVHALHKYTNRFIWLEDGDLLILSRQTIKIFDQFENEVSRIEREVLPTKTHDDDLGLYEHYMQKEIFEQPLVFTKNTAQLDYSSILKRFGGNKFEELLSKIKIIHLVACGSSYHAALVAKYWLEAAGIVASVEIASEYRYRAVVVLPNTLFITLSQSGETADVIAALHKAKQMNYISTLAICNVFESTIVRESQFAYLIEAGHEIGVATTKAFTAQLLGLWYLTQFFRIDRNFNVVIHLNTLTEQILTLEPKIIKLAKLLKKANNVFYLGRGVNSPIAMEGALKLKEISYLHAEAYPAGELKHGPLALIDSKVFVVALLPNDGLHEKMIANLQEISSRSGKILLFADQTLYGLVHKDWFLCPMPEVNIELVPIVYTIALQLLAYHVAVLKEVDVDQPRNLAKSVTVE